MRGECVGHVSPGRVRQLWNGVPNTKPMRRRDAFHDSGGEKKAGAEQRRARLGWANGG